MKIKGFTKKHWLWIIGCLILIVALWHLVTDAYREEEKSIRSRFRQSVKETFPEQSDKFLQSFGLFYYGTGQEVAEVSTKSQDAIVLVHGLDDPGKVWQNLAPALVREGFYVWLMHYPNDQPIGASSKLFFEELKAFRKSDIIRISIVAHSMGGLVSREMLTRPDLDYDHSVKEGQVPKVVSLTMVGTPNHGSEMARFRIFGEMRDQLARIQKGEASWIGAILDGAGEAKIDLLPGSRFLTGLNNRPHPAGVGMLVIAGISSPWNEDDINKWMENLDQELPSEWKNQIDTLGNYMISMTHGLGDGLVTIESACLEGVPHITVDGTHLTMIRNITHGSKRVPPAVPIIIKRLKEMK
jgi:pimeloyl-ACP methyl ester carboxylesterase